MNNSKFTGTELSASPLSINRSDQASPKAEVVVNGQTVNQPVALAISADPYTELATSQLLDQGQGGSATEELSCDHENVSS